MAEGDFAIRYYSFAIPPCSEVFCKTAKLTGDGFSRLTASCCDIRFHKIQATGKAIHASDPNFSEVIF